MIPRPDLLSAYGSFELVGPRSIKKNPTKDLFYAMSHGVNRATLKRGKDDSRIHFLNNLIKKYI